MNNLRTIGTNRLVDGEKIDNLPANTTAELATKADSSSVPSDLGDLSDVAATSPIDWQALVRNNAESRREPQTTSGSWDMTKAVYDPTNVAGDAFSMDNMVEWTNTKILTATERANIAANTDFLDGIEAGADVTDTANVTAAGAAMTANNLSDLANAVTARTNLWLGTAATTNTWTSSGNVPVLDGSGKLNASVIPSLAVSEYLGDFTDTTAALANAWVQASQRGDWFTVQTSWGLTYIVTTDSPTTVWHITLMSTPTSDVESVNGKTWVVVIDPDDLDDTSTTNKFTTAAEISKLAGIEAGADVTDTANVTAAGALMDSEVDADIKTLSLPANTTISTFWASLVDDADAATARTTLGVDAAWTDNSTKAVASEINTGTDTSKVVTPDALAWSNAFTKEFCVPIFDASTDVSTWDGKAYITIPTSLNGMDLVWVHAEVLTAGTTWTTDIQIHNVTQAVDMLSTKITIDSGETWSDTAATPAVIDTANDDVASYDVIRVDVDTVSTTAPQWLVVVLLFRLP